MRSAHLIWDGGIKIYAVNGWLCDSDQVEAIMNDFIQLKSQSNVYDAEHMVEGSSSIWYISIL